jgi:uncharacterized RDD family membrane protein YckC
MGKYHNYPALIYAGFWIRFFAYCLDLVIIASVQRILLFFLADGGIKSGISLVIFLAYFVLMTKLNQGQTLGKMAFGLRVVSFNEESLSWTTVFIREFFGRYLQKVFMIMYILTVFTPKKQHVIDLLLDTSVIVDNNLLLYREKPILESNEIEGGNYALY